MPYKIAKRGDKYRILDKQGKIAKNKGGSAMDGGGHKSKPAAERQVNAVTMSKAGVKPRKRGKR